MTQRKMEHIVLELEKAIEAFLAVPTPAILSSDEESARCRLEKALCRLHVLLVKAPACGAVIPTVLH